MTLRPITTQDSLAYTTTRRWRNILAQKIRERLLLLQVPLTFQRRRGFSILLTAARAPQLCVGQLLQVTTMKSSHSACAASAWGPMSPQILRWVPPNSRTTPRKTNNHRPRTKAVRRSLQRVRIGTVHPTAGKCLDPPALQPLPTPMSTSPVSPTPAVAATQAGIPSAQHPAVSPGVPTSPRT